jgi:hypothetical protein
VDESQVNIGQEGVKAKTERERLQALISQSAHGNISEEVWAQVDRYAAVIIIIYCIIPLVFMRVPKP